MIFGFLVKSGFKKGFWLGKNNQCFIQLINEELSSVVLLSEDHSFKDLLRGSQKDAPGSLKDRVPDILESRWSLDLL